MQLVPPAPISPGDVVYHETIPGAFTVVGLGAAPGTVVCDKVAEPGANVQRAVFNTSEVSHEPYDGFDIGGTAAPVDPATCNHHLLAHTNVHELGDEPELVYLEITLRCTRCDAHYEPAGDLPIGVSPYRPTTSVDGRELNIPMWREGIPPRKGMVSAVLGHPGRVSQ